MAKLCTLLLAVLVLAFVRCERDLFKGDFYTFATESMSGEVFDIVERVPGEGRVDEGGNGADPLRISLPLAHGAQGAPSTSLHQFSPEDELELRPPTDEPQASRKIKREGLSNEDNFVDVDSEDENKYRFIPVHQKLYIRQKIGNDSEEVGTDLIYYDKMDDVPTIQHYPPDEYKPILVYIPKMLRPYTMKKGKKTKGPPDLKREVLGNRTEAAEGPSGSRGAGKDNTVLGGLQDTADSGPMRRVLWPRPGDTDSTGDSVASSPEPQDGKDTTAEAREVNDLTTEAPEGNGSTAEAREANDLTTEAPEGNGSTAEPREGNDLTTEAPEGNDTTVELRGGNDLTTEAPEGNDTTVELRGGKDLTTEAPEGNDTTVELRGGNYLTTEAPEGNDTTVELRGGNDLTTEVPEGNDTIVELRGGNDLTAEPRGGNDLRTEHREANDLTAEHREGNDTTTEPREGNDLTAEPRGGNDTTAEPQLAESLLTESLLGELRCTGSRNDTYPVADTCSQVVRCVEGRASLHTCPGTLQVNPVTRQCDVIENSICSLTCPEGNGSFPVPGDCQGFLRCKNWAPRYQLCPADMHWDTARGRCGPQHQAGCPMKCLASEEVRPYPGCCHSYIVCQDGVPHFGRCPSDLHFSVVSSACVPPSMSECSEADSVPRQSPALQGDPLSHMTNLVVHIWNFFRQSVQLPAQHPSPQPNY